MRAEDRSVVFVTPFFAEATIRFLHAAVHLPGMRTGVVSQDPVERLPESVRARLAGHWRIADGLDPEQIRQAVFELGRRMGPPARLVGALEQLQVALAQVRQSLGIRGMGVEQAQNFRDKARMKEVLRAAGVPCARHRLAATAAEAFAFAAEIGFPLVVKPPAGAAARDTHRVDDREQLTQLMHAAPPGAQRPTLLEEFIVGEEHSFDTVTIEGRHVWHSLTHYRPGPLEVVRNPWIQWTVLLPREVDHPRYDEIRRVGFRALDALGMDSGLSHMEWFKRTDGSVAVSEVAARPPGAQFTTLMSYAHDLDFYSAWVRTVVFDQFDPPERRYAAGIAYLRGQGSGRVKAIHGLDQAQQELGGLVVEVQLPKPGQQPSSSYEGDGYVVLRDPRTDVVERGLERLVSIVRVELG